VTRKSLLQGCMVAAMSLTLGQGAGAQEVTLRLAHVLAPTEPLHVASERFAELVEERSDGRIEVEVFPSGELGTNLDLYEQVRLGAPVIQISDPGYLSDYVADFGILNGPYLLDDPNHFSKLTDSDWYNGIVEEVAEKENMRVLSLGWLFGSRHVISDREIRTPSDIEGLTIRVPPNVMWIETFKALGARGETLAWQEVYSGLASGVVDAAEAPLSSLWASKLYENADTISMTGHFTAFIGPIMSEELFQSLSPELRGVLLESAEDAGAFMTELVASKQGELKAQLEEQGVTFVEDVDRAAFRQATRVVYDKFPEWSEGLYERVQDILNE